ncbi:MAG: amidohydrolase [Nitrospinae bacterium]|nr:amidohydrolase [Nitrospinota bacterium]
MLIDTHVHLVTHRMAAKTADAFARRYPSAFERAFHKGRSPLSPALMAWLKPLSVERLAALWIEEMDRHGVDHACFLPIFGGSHGELDEFLSLAPGRFSGYLFLSEPHTKKALREVRSWRKKNPRFVGVKLYPSLSHISVADDRLFPLYETLAELGMPALIHFGITTAPVADYRYTNPLDLQLPSRLFPDTRFIVAHFGAGFFRELLLLGYHAANVYVDTSGTNNWREFLPAVMPLSTIFRRTVEVYGAERILFGTDSMLKPDAGYRGHILAEQRKAVGAAKLTAAQKEAIFAANGGRLFGLPGA